MKKPGLAEAHEALAQIYERSGHPDWAAVERGKAKALRRPTAGPRASNATSARGGTVRSSRRLGRCGRRRADTGSRARPASWPASLHPPHQAAALAGGCARPGRRPARAAALLETLEELRKATSAWPEDLRIRRELATLHFIAHEYAEARPLLEDLLKHEPDSAELILLLGEAWVESKEPAKAIPASRRPSAPTRTCSGPARSSAARTSRPDRPSAPCLISRPRCRRTRTAACTSSSPAPTARPAGPTRRPGPSRPSRSAQGPRGPAGEREAGVRDHAALARIITRGRRFPK